MYHGTPSLENAALIEQNGFRASSGGLLGPGVYVSRDMGKAEQYRKGGVMFEVLVRVGLVCDIKDHQVPVPVGSKWKEMKNANPDAVQDMKAAKDLVASGWTREAPWHAAGYDTAWVPADCSPLVFVGGVGYRQGHVEETCVHDASRISVLRRVKWDTDRADVNNIEWMWKEDRFRVGAQSDVDDEGWVAYSRENSIMIESHWLARAKGGRSQFIITIENSRKLFHEHTGMKYEIDLERLTQRNVMTEYKRHLRRRDRTGDKVKEVNPVDVGWSAGESGSTPHLTNSSVHSSCCCLQ